MDKGTYSLLETYMISCMEDSAHDKEHIYRVLYNALRIARKEKNVDYDVLICACLLHDIGRKEQFENPELCHAIVGSEKAYSFLVSKGYEIEYAEKTRAKMFEKLGEINELNKQNVNYFIEEITKTFGDNK